MSSSPACSNPRRIANLWHDQSILVAVRIWGKYKRDSHPPNMSRRPTDLLYHTLIRTLLLSHCHLSPSTFITVLLSAFPFPQPCFVSVFPPLPNPVSFLFLTFHPAGLCPWFDRYDILAQISQLCDSCLIHDDNYVPPEPEPR